MSFIDDLTVAEVNNAKTFAAYCQQTTGTPMPNRKEWATLNTMLKEFFEQYPHLGYNTLCAVAQWCRSKNRRFSGTHQIVGQYRYAWQAGAIPEFAPVRDRDAELDDQITEALKVEQDREWRRRLVAAQTRKARYDIFTLWSERRAGVAA